MDPAQSQHGPSLSDDFAEERTFLAWIRTGLALMGFGFVVARFGLFLQELQLVQRNLPFQSHQLSIWFGTALILVGVAVNIYAARRHSLYLAQVSSGSSRVFRPSKHLALLGLLLALVGLAMAIYLALLHNSAPAPQSRTSSLNLRSDLCPQLPSLADPTPTTASSANAAIILSTRPSPNCRRCSNRRA